MYVQILSISSILLVIYLLIVLFIKSDFFSPSLPEIEYHMGCFSQDNPINHSVSIRQYLSKINSGSSKNIALKSSFQIANKVKYNQISKGVARDFEKYLNEYYQIKTKGIYEQNFYKSLSLAEQKFQNCKQKISSSFDKDKCLNNWEAFLTSQRKHEQLKQVLKNKIQRKQQQQRKISYLILDTNYSDAEEYQKNITDQIFEFNTKLEQINVRKIQILTKKAPIEQFIVTNKTLLEQNQKLLDQCIKNKKIIIFCNELNQQLSTLELTFTKKDIQTKIQRKRFIIDNFLSAIRNAQKLGDKQTVQISKHSLQKNKAELQMLLLRVSDFQSFEESYCSRCSDQKIQELIKTIDQMKLRIQRHQGQFSQFINEQQLLSREVTIVVGKLEQLEQQRDFHINSNICVTPECQEQRSKDIKQFGKVLNEMKKQVLDYKYSIQEHNIEHNNKIDEVNGVTPEFNEIIDCLYSKQYYQFLKDRKPEHNKNEVMKIQTVKTKLIKKLEALTEW